MPMAKPKVCAERKLRLVDSGTGQSTEIRVEIGTPKWTEPDQQASCLVFVHGLMEHPREIFGSDRLNALECSLRFVESELRAVRPVQSVQWPDGEDYFD
jgi:hypothetical protein